MANDLSAKIHILRKQKNMTLEQVADIVGVGKSTVRKWETGMIANMKRDKIALLAKALGTTPAYLMGWKENPTPTEGELNEGEKIWLDLYHRISEDSRDMLVKLVDAFDNLPAEERKFLLSVIELKLKK
jgi:transcriptional regulator with XRE-family HTH domain